MTILEAIHLGMQHHQAGRLPEAESIYRQILTQQPDYPPALHLLGLIAQKAGQRDAAMQLIGRAIALSPRQPEFHGSMGLLLEEIGQTNQAIAAYRQALILNPNLAQAHNNLGTALAATGQMDEAVARLRQAIALVPDYPDPYYNLANILKNLRRLDEAISLYHQALSRRPHWPEALNNLGITYMRRGEPEKAIASFNQAIAVAPNCAPALSNLGDVLCKTGRLEQSAAACRQALQLRPDLAESHNNLGNALCALGQFDDAIAAYRQALALKPDYVQAHGNLANAYFAHAELDQALCLYRTALALQPDYASAHWNMGLALLTQGDFEHGWPEFEWRWKVDGLSLRGRDLRQPRWNGEDLAGKRILIHSEQAIGDTIFFLRYLPQVAQRGGKIVLACESSLLPLLKGLDGVIEATDIDHPPACDLHCSLMSLAGIFKTTLQTIPAAPYLRPPSNTAEQWKTRIPQDDRLKIGFVWANKPDPRDRCPAPDQWSALAQVPGVWLCSLQKGQWAHQHPPGLDIADWTDDLHDFADTAALIDALDLVVTVDTAVVHLAAAMGKPTWVVLKKVPDWRWMMDRADSPWYPSARLFRQKQFGQWQAPIEEIAQALRDQAAVLKNPNSV